MGATQKKMLDRVPKKRGPHWRMRPSEIVGRAGHFRMIFDQVWDRLWPLLSRAQTDADVISSFEEGARPYTQNFMPHLATLTLATIRDPRFPKRREPQIDFLAESLAGVGVVRPRRSRDICAQERAKAKREQSAPRIERYEFYVECSCGYRGPSRDHACAKCGAKIDFGFSPFPYLNPFTG